ncbi:MAG: cytochrome b5 domain-containing protein, partial [Patescibacteria group bacterium]|nr:cytochrome b5 domain-containing protein [Patescibacteria group bacterium]
MKKIIVYIIILFVIVGLSGILYLFDANNQNITSQNNQNNIQTTNINPEVKDVQVSQTDANDLKIENLYIMSDIEKHNTKESCWSVIRENVYDLTSWITKHPGGEKAILNLCGKDGTSLFEKQHGGEKIPE